MGEKPGLGIYWAASCGGCEITLLNLNERLLELKERFDFLFCPCLLDVKKQDIEDKPDGSIALTLFNGALRTEEDARMALLLRRKSRLLVAFGSCAMLGGVAGLGNFFSAGELLANIFPGGITPEPNPGLLPQPESRVPEGILLNPPLLQRVLTLAQVVPVDYSVPGCPPEPHQVEKAFALLAGSSPPPQGSVLGAGQSTLCGECKKRKGKKAVDKFYRIHELIPDPEICLLEQGLLCLGIATRDGCGALCPEVNMPCTGCYGPPEGVPDQGMQMVAALGSLLETGEERGAPPEVIRERVDSVLRAIPDYAGTFYKYGLANSFWKGLGK